MLCKQQLTYESGKSSNDCILENARNASFSAPSIFTLGLVSVPRNKQLGRCRCWKVTNFGNTGTSHPGVTFLRRIWVCICTSYSYHIIALTLRNYDVDDF